MSSVRREKRQKIEDIKKNIRDAILVSLKKKKKKIEKRKKVAREKSKIRKLKFTGSESSSFYLIGEIRSIKYIRQQFAFANSIFVPGLTSITLDINCHARNNST